MGQSDLAGALYRALVKQLGEEDDFAVGWQGRVAGLLGVTQGYISKQHLGTAVGVGRAAMSSAVAKLGIDSSFFYEDADGEPDYRDYLTHKSVEPLEEKPTTELDSARGSRFVEGWISVKVHDGKITPDEAAALRRVRFDEKSVNAPQLETTLRGIRAARGE